MIKYKQLSSATSGTVTVTDAQDDIEFILTAVSLIAAITVALPTTPFDGQRITIRSDSNITLLSITTPVGTIVNTITTMVGGSSIQFVYDSAGLKWHR